MPILFPCLAPMPDPAAPLRGSGFPGAERAEAFDLAGRRLGALTSVDKRGLFEGKISGPPRPVKYKAQGMARNGG